MKIFFTICFCVMLCMVANAQKKTTDEVFYKNELGVNISQFIQRHLPFFGDGSGYGINYPYLFEYWRRWDEKNAFRFSFSGDYTQRNDKGKNFEQYNNPSKGFKIRTRGGYQRTVQVARRWGVYGGADLLFYYHYNKLKELEGNGYESTIKEKEFGGGAALGLTFKLHSRLTLSTEGDLYLVMTRGSHITKDGDDPEFGGNAITKRTYFIFYTPLDIRLSFRF